MKTGLNIVAVILALMGIIWILQGINILPGSFMTGDLKWAVIGAVLVVVSGGILYYTSRRMPPS
ncbi:MAG: hypothetical protein U0670_07355 [Anaerolineae bacterium]